MSDLLSKIWLEETKPQRLSASDWELLLSQAARGSLMARLSQHLTNTGWMPQVPSVVAQQFVGPRVFVARQQIEVFDEVERIRQAVLGCTDTIVLLKGAAYLVAELPPFCGRLFSDIDLLVRPDEVSSVESALLGAGWITRERDPYNQRYYRRWMHEIPPLTHVIRASSIDLHHTITPPTSRFRIDASLLYRQLVPTRYQNVYVLSPADMVLHSAVHLFQEGEFDQGLRDLLDLRDLLISFSQKETFWDDLQTRARDLGLQEPLSFALFHLHRLFGYSAPDTCVALTRQVDEWQARHRLLNWCLNFALRPNHPSCDTQFTAVARWLLFVRSHWIRMPVHLLIPHLFRKGWMKLFKLSSVPTLSHRNAVI